MRRSHHALCAFILAAAPAGAAPQQRAASLEVRVLDPAKRPIAGVTVSATPDGGTGQYDCTTADDGRCMLLALPPGRYQVTSLSRLAPTSTPASAPPPTVLPAPAIVQVAPGDHVILRLVVGGTPPARGSTVVQAERTGEAAFGWDDLRDLATRKRLLDALRVDPGWAAVEEGAGSPLAAAARTFVEAVEAPLPDPRADSVGALRIEAEGAGADSARGTAGAIDAVLPSGGLRLSGDLSLGFEGSALIGRPRPFSRYSPWDPDRAETGLTVPTTPWMAISPAGSVGGRARHPGVSFHASGAFSRRARHRDVVFLEDPEQVRRRFSWSSWSLEGTGTVTASGRGGRRARFAAVYGRGRDRGSAPALEPDQGLLPDGRPTAGLTRAPFESAGRARARWENTGADSRRLTLSAALDWPLGRRASISADAALSNTAAWTPPSFRSNLIRHLFATSNRKVPGIAPDEVHPAGYADTASSRGTLEDGFRRLLVNVEGVWSPRRARSHVLSTGVRAERLSDAVYVGDVRPVIELHWGRPFLATTGEAATGRYGYYTVSRAGTIGEAGGAVTAAWWRDRWSPADRFTADIGLRVERESAPSYRRGPGIQPVVFGFARKLAPRLAAQWRLDADGRWRADASFGLYYDRLDTPLARALFGARHDVTEVWTLDTLDWRHLACDEGLRTCPGRFVERLDAEPPWNARDPTLRPWFGETTRVDPGLRPMRTTEWQTGLERRLGSRTSLGLRYTGKRLDRAVEDVGLSLPGAESRSVLANPGFGYARQVSPAWPAFPLPRAARRYDELEAEFRRPGHPLALAARYRWSRLAGNYGGLAQADEGGAASSNTTKAFDAIYSSYDHRGNAVSGPLPGDRPHHASAEATLVLPFGTTISAAFLVQSGRPESSQILFRGATVWSNGYGDLGRQPAYSQLDLQVRQDVRLKGHLLVLEATADNVLDQATPSGFYSTNPYRDALAAPEDAFFNPPWDPAAWAAAMRAGGSRLRNERLYLVPNRFQGPRRVALQASIRF